MEHPYKDYENSRTWNVINKLIKDLVDNNDIELLTPKEYVIGYLCKGLSKHSSKRSKTNGSVNKIIKKNEKDYDTRRIKRNIRV